MDPTGPSSSYAASVPADHPSAYYRLVDPSGTLMADSSGNAADGQYGSGATLNRAAALPDDPDGSVAVSGSAAGSANPGLPEGNSAPTVEAWVNTTGPSCCQAYQIVASYGSTVQNESFIVSVGANTIDVDSYNENVVGISTQRPINDGRWHLITVTCSGTTVTAYLDGQLVGTASLSGSLDTVGSNLQVGTFSGGQGSTDAFLGNMQELAVYPSALDAAQISAQFAASGYSRPTAPVFPHAAYGGENAAQITWGISQAANTGVLSYLVTVTKGLNKGESQTVSGNSTATVLTGLAAKAQTFSVQALDAFGWGPPATSNAYVVPGAKSTYDSVVIKDKPKVFYRLADTTNSGTKCNSSSSGVPLLTGVPDLADSSGNGETGTYGCANESAPGPLAKDAATAAGSPQSGQWGGNIGTAPPAVDSTLPLGNSARTVSEWVRSGTPPIISRACLSSPGANRGRATDSGSSSLRPMSLSSRPPADHIVCHSLPTE